MPTSREDIVTLSPTSIGETGAARHRPLGRRLVVPFSAFPNDGLTKTAPTVAHWEVCMLRSQRAKSAFTLIELLVVIAIIAILAAILFPVFAQAKVAAKKAQSISNLKQIGLSWFLYNGDYDDTLMRIRQPEADPNKAVYFWGEWDNGKQTLDPTRGLLYPYTKSKGIQSDPSLTNDLRKELGEDGYAYNYNYFSPSNYDASFNEIPVPVNYGQIGQVADTVAFASSARMTFSAPFVVEANGYLEPPSSQYPTFQGRHSGFGVVLWADGHTKARKPVLRVGTFGYGGVYNDTMFTPVNLGEISPGDLNTDDLFDLN